MILILLIALFALFFLSVWPAKKAVRILAGIGFLALGFLGYTGALVNSNYTRDYHVVCFKRLVEFASPEKKKQAEDALSEYTDSYHSESSFSMLPVLKMMDALNKEIKTEPNQSPETTTMAVTPAASHPSRQP
jgi:heme A synthase